MKNTLFAIAVAFGIFNSAQTAHADDFDKKTNITVNETILIPGGTLAPGKYVMKLANVTANRHVVQIFNEDQDRLQATILAFNNYRLEPTDKTVLRYWETPSGSPPALRAWFFPGDNYGQEFAYPKEMAELLARENNSAKVPSYEATATQPTVEQLTQLEVRDVDSTPAPAQQAQVTPPPQTEVVAQVPATPEPAPGSEVVTNAPLTPEPTILAQNEPARPADTLSDTSSSELPRTASITPWVMAIGVFALLSALCIRVISKA